MQKHPGSGRGRHLPMDVSAIYINKKSPVSLPGNLLLLTKKLVSGLFHCSCLLNRVAAVYLNGNVVTSFAQAISATLRGR